jgi:MFS transporter, DHA2 family, multidrug resistance protein
MEVNGNEKKENSSIKWWVLATVIIGTFLGRLDQTVVSLATPKIINDFGITVTAAGWISTAYIIANAVFVPIWGKLGDTWGRKKVYIIGFLGFIIASVLAGVAWNFPSMIIFRVIQAVAGSADYPTAMALLAATFPVGKERAQALGIWSASFAAAVVFGPLIGGPLIDNFGWRSVFMINLPVGIVGLAMAFFIVKESVSGDKKKRFDIWGAAALGVALSALVMVLEKGLDWGWLSGKSLVTYFVTIIATAVFIWIEKRHEDPIVDLKFFKIPVFVNVLANNFIVFMGMMGCVFLIPVFAATYMGLDATETGLLFMPMAAGMMIASPFGGMLTGKVEARFVIFVSTLVAAAGLFMFLGMDPRSGSLDIMLPLFVMALGLGFGMAQRTNIIASAVPDSEVGIASSVLALVRNIAGAFGIAVFGTVLNSATKSHAISGTLWSSLGARTAENYYIYTTLISLKAQISAYHTVFASAGFVLLFGAITSLGIKVKEKAGVHLVVE